jgi:hypothetical protein
MSTQDDVINLIHKVQGQQDVEDIRKAFEKEINALRELDRELAAGKISQQQYASGAAGMKTNLEQLGAQLIRAEAATQKASSGLKGLGQTGLQTGRIIQDFAQGGVAGILNNIEGFTQAIGGGPGLAGALTALGVAFFILRPHIAAFAEQLGLGATKTEADRMKELEENTHRTAEETAKLNKYKKEQHEIEALRAALPKAEKDRKSAVEEIIGEAGLETTANKLAGHRLAAAGGPANLFTEADRAEFEAIRTRDPRQFGGKPEQIAADLAEKKEKAEARIRKEMQVKAEKDLTAAALDADVHRRLAGQVANIPGMGQMAVDLREALPENLKAARIDEKNRERASQDAKDEAEKQKAKKARGEHFRKLNEKEQDDLLRDAEDDAKQEEHDEKEGQRTAEANSKAGFHAAGEKFEAEGKPRANPRDRIAQGFQQGLGVDDQQALALANQSHTIGAAARRMGKVVSDQEVAGMLMQQLAANQLNLQRSLAQVRATLQAFGRGNANQARARQPNWLP